MSEQIFLTNLSSKVLVLVAFMLVFRTLVAIESTCDDNMYAVYNKETGLTSCLPCQQCAPGQELEVQCGSVVSPYVVLGNCIPCKPGTHSPTKNSRPCQVCRSSKCLQHEVVTGSCKIDGFDSTTCTGKCIHGYLMNKAKTVCERYESWKNGTKKPEKTATEDGESDHHSLSTGAIVGIVIAVLLAIFLLIALGQFCWHQKRSKATKGKGDSSSLKNPMLINPIMEENGDAGRDGNVPHCPESTAGFVRTAEGSNINSRPLTPEHGTNASHVVYIPVGSPLNV